MKTGSIISLGAITSALNERGMLTPRGGLWHKTSVSNLIGRMPYYGRIKAILADLQDSMA